MKKNIIKTTVITVVVAGVLLGMHLLVNNLPMLEFLKKIHGG